MSKFPDFALFVTEPNIEPENNVCIVRLTTSYWSDKRGVHIKKSLTFLRRKSIGFNILEEDIGMIGAEFVVKHITNLDSCEDGVYEVVTCNESRDWESGYVDGYDYQLIKCNLEEK